MIPIGLTLVTLHGFPDCLSALLHPAPHPGRAPPRTALPKLLCRMTSGLDQPMGSGGRSQRAGGERGPGISSPRSGCWALCFLATAGSLYNDKSVCLVTPLLTPPPFRRKFNIWIAHRPQPASAPHLTLATLNMLLSTPELLPLLPLPRMLLHDSP